MAQVLLKAQGAIKATLEEASTVAGLLQDKQLSGVVVTVNGVVASGDTVLNDGDKVIYTAQTKGA